MVLLGCSPRLPGWDKQAQEPPAPSFVPASIPTAADGGAKANSQLRRAMLLTSLASLGIGTGVTAASGLLRDHKIPRNSSITPPTDIDYPARPEEKIATAPAASAELPTFSPRYWLGRGANSMNEHPLALPGLAASAILPALLGSHLTQKHIHGGLKKNHTEELAQAQQGYDDQMAGMYDPKLLHSLPEKTSQALDKLYDAYVKQAAGPVGGGFMPATASLPTPAATAATPHIPASSNLAGRAGLVASMALLSGLGGTYAGYQIGEGSKQENLLASAAKQRALLKAQAAPEPTFIRPRSTKPKKEESKE